jgi:AraC family transcriptional regulator, regulatory protein of adaptative response / DNA-3-methyladenine glycosylase II
MADPASAETAFAARFASMLTRDVRCDGVFWTGVRTTGIYCLPSCPARKPRAQNVAFFDTEAAARAAGLRPCKRCRPDRFFHGKDADEGRLANALAFLDAHPAEIPDVEALAVRVGVSRSTLHELLRRREGITPAERIHGSRIRAAMALLCEGRLSATEVAFEVGYESVSGFYGRFKKATGRSPATWARQAEPCRLAALRHLC